MHLGPLLVAWWGCTAHPLGEVPITGADPELEQQLRDAIGRFERWVGPDRIQLNEVTIGSLPSGTFGQYAHRRRTVRISDAIRDARFRERVLVHELCHALDRQNDLVDGQPSAFHQLNDVLGPKAVVSEIEGTTSNGFDEVHHEEFALLCEWGPPLTQLVGHRCDDDDDSVDAIRAVIELLSRDVWQGDIEPSLALGVRRTWTAPFPPDLLYAITDESEEVLSLTVGRELEGPSPQADQVFLTIADGAPASGEGRSWPIDAYARALPQPLPLYADIAVSPSERLTPPVPYGSFVDDDGSTAVIVEVTVPLLGTRLSRLLILGADAAWTPTHACPGPAGGLFRAQSQFFTIRATGSIVAWHSLESIDLVSAH